MIDLSFTIVVIFVIFILFSYIICCYGDSAGRRRNRVLRKNNQRSPSNMHNVTHNPTPFVHASPTHIGFNVTSSEGPSTVIPPVGIAPSAPSQFPTPYPPESVVPYPPVVLPYPVSESPNFPQPQQTPSAPVYDAQPPSYSEATKQNDRYKY